MDHVYREMCETGDVVEVNIEDFIRQIPADILERVCQQRFSSQGVRCILDGLNENIKTNVLNIPNLNALSLFKVDSIEFWKL